MNDCACTLEASAQTQDPCVVNDGISINISTKIYAQMYVYVDNVMNDGMCIRIRLYAVMNHGYTGISMNIRCDE